MGDGYDAWSTIRDNSLMSVYSANNINGVWIMIGCAANNPDDLLKGHPLYNKAGRSWTDYEFLLNPNPATNEVFRYCAPGTNHQDYYPTTPATSPALGGMTSTDVTYKYTAGGNFEAAFKWSAIPDLKLIVDKLTATNQGAKITLAWKVKSSTDVSNDWQEVAGMAEAGIYGWSPYWNPGFNKCNTPWTLINGDGSMPVPMAIEPSQQKKVVAVPFSMSVLSKTERTVQLLYSVPSAQNVRISVFAPDGRFISVLVNEYKSAGKYTISWNAPAPATYLVEYRCGFANKTVQKISMVR